MEGLLQGLGGLLRLNTVAIEALLCFETAALSGFGVFVSGSFAWGHSKILRSVGVFCGCSMHKRPRQRPSPPVWENGSPLHDALPHFLLSFPGALRYKGAKKILPLPALYPESLRSRWRVSDDL